MSATITAAGLTSVVVVKSDFQVGWDIYVAGGADSDCRTPEQVRGWWMALQAEVDADMCEVLAADGYSPDEMDEVLDDCRGIGCRFEIPRRGL